MSDTPHETPRRVQWTERRGAESFFVIAENGGAQWEFWERDAWEVRWYRTGATETLREHLTAALRIWPQPADFRESGG